MVAVNSAMSSGPRVLSSWKEIAQYLGVNVRTAQKWERERSLPVRRLRGARSRVSADSDDLDVWRHQLADNPRLEDRCYRWPLGHSLTVEVRFLGEGICPAQIDVLCRYLEVVKSALAAHDK